MNDIYREEYIREQARLAAQRDAKPKKQQKSRLLPYAAPAMLIGLLVYSVISLGSNTGISPGAFLELDFILAVLALTALFLWARFN